ncbi:DNA primase [Prevotella sp. A2931]|uniref:DNA primase n=1 Tax=Prevotella illustrans TaxID=2800387 RepID=A0ABS3M427_9BACT|nr:MULTISPECIES: DNA primase [Prevotella]MBO1362934.1 DNA primase [Prevotella illustrans]PTL27160.1 DNA primase [Prevotella sp. oral taxon 820]
MIDRQTIDRIKDAANIVDVVSEFVTLHKSGSNYKGLCPFHNEKTPSFYVSPSRGTCHCFGCGKGGNAVGFIMEHEQMDYPEALRWLAAKYHIEIKERELSDEEKREQGERESMFIINDWAEKYFQHILHHDVDGLAVGMQYFRSRGFRDDIIEKFHLGYDLPDRHALAKAALAKGYKGEFLLKTGICYQNDRGELIDRYAGRVVFPWIGNSGRVVGFTARVLDSRTKGVSQKYVNSPDSEIYHKGYELYGIYQAKKAMAKNDRVYLVEGQADVIAMHQSGIENVVAGSGTALTLPQIHMLRRFTNNITMIYDNDEAGIHAALKGTDMLLSEGMNLKVLLLPAGEDPDSFARKHTASDFQAYIKEHETDFIRFKTQLLLDKENDPLKRSEAINSIVRSISVIPNQILRDTYIHDSMSYLNINERTLINTMNRMIREDKNQEQKAQIREAERQPAMPLPSLEPATPLQQATKVEQMLIQLVIRYGEQIIFDHVEDHDGNLIDLTLAQYIHYTLSADGLYFHTPLYNQILDEAVAHAGKEGFMAEPYFVHHHDIGISQLAVDMSTDKFRLSESQQMKETVETLRQRVIHLILDFRMDYVEQKLKDLQKEIAQAVSDHDRMMKLLEEFKDLQMIRNALAQQLGNNIIM